MSLPVKQAYELVKSIQLAINELLNKPEHVQNLLGINANFKQISTRLEFMGGILEPKSDLRQTAGSRRFKPITSFMGEPIARGQLLSAKSPELSPDEVTKKQFLEKVDILYNRLPEMSANALLNSFTIDEDRTVLRGVAKRAGVKNWQDGMINEEFINDIKIGIGIKAEDALTQALIEQNLKEQEAKRQQTTTVYHPSVRILTQDDFDNHPDLMAELGAAVGDQLEITTTGDKLLTQAKFLNQKDITAPNETLESKDHHSITVVENKPLITGETTIRNKRNTGR